MMVHLESSDFVRFLTVFLENRLPGLSKKHLRSRLLLDGKKERMYKITLIQIGTALLLLALLGGCSFPQPSPASNPQANPLTLIPSITKAAASANTPTPMVAPTIERSLRAYAFQHRILIGAAVDYDPLFQDKLYAQTLSREFSILTPENAMKFGVIHPAQNVYVFSEADAIVAFAKQNGMQVRGHTLVWHNQLPQWLVDGNFTRDEMIAILKDHIMAVVGHYRGQVTVWDVVNEAVDDNGSLRDSIWLKTIGPEYMDMAFNWAHEADPQAQLFYNDYGNEDLGKKSNAIYALV
jgi:endo-1,4-beta-xylanase